MQPLPLVAMDFYKGANSRWQIFQVIRGADHKLMVAGVSAIGTIKFVHLGGKLTSRTQQGDHSKQTESKLLKIWPRPLKKVRLPTNGDIYRNAYELKNCSRENSLYCGINYCLHPFFFLPPLSFFPACS